MVEATAAWNGAIKRAMAKSRKSRIKKIGELIPPEEKIKSKTIETKMMVAKKKERLSDRKRNLETK
jgi:hypothetical protein